MKYYKSIILIIVIGLAAQGCSDPSYPNPQVSSVTRYAKVLFVNASPDAQSLVYQVNNAQVVTLNPQVVSGYLNVNPGSEQIRIKNAVFGVVGSDTLALKADLVTQSTLTGSASYTVFVVDSVNRPFTKGSGFTSKPGGLTFIGPLSDNLAIQASKSGIRFYNLAPGSPTVYLSNAGASLGSISNSTAYRAGSSSFSSVAPNTYTLQVTSGSISGTLLASTTVTLSPGKAYSVFLTGKIVNPGAIVKVAYALNVIQHN
ncbi:MAG: DUF4397 domain-containing protein [Bacteroidetes bacterium]|nr:DUF4397 domain-containing protein [Bacteroidota bacterium]MBS1540486.1 DUF4397 domain-containing protein [Bacteroidota bacterium]